MVNSAHQVKQLSRRWAGGGISGWGSGRLDAAKQVGDRLGGSRAHWWFGWEGAPVSKFSVSIGWYSSWPQESCDTFNWIWTTTIMHSNKTIYKSNPVLREYISRFKIVHTLTVQLVQFILVKEKAVKILKRWVWFWHNVKKLNCYWSHHYASTTLTWGHRVFLSCMDPTPTLVCMTWKSPKLARSFVTCLSN